MSRRPGQRRRGGGREQHSDPNLDADALLNPNALEEQLSRRLAKSSPVPEDGATRAGADVNDENAAPATKKPAAPGIDAAALSAVIASEVAEQAKYQQEAEAVFRQGGDAAVQEALRAEIAKTKKLESDVAQMKKKVDAAKRQQDAKSIELTKLAQQKEIIHAACKKLIAERERLEAVLAEGAAEDEKRREEVKAKFDKDVEGIIAKVDEQAAQKVETLKENAELTKKFDELKANFDGMMDGKMSEWKNRDEETRAVVATLQERMVVHDKLAQIVEQREAEAENLKRGTEAYTEQAAIYEARMSDFEGALGKSAEVVELTAKREQEYHAEIKRFEEAKAADVVARKAAEEEVRKVKARVRDLRKQLTQIEKTKATAEKRCRAAQDAIRKREQKK
mmetsp:Transcript_35507/g.109495  ORF Transcript_35507/g.109495 Transcript_35507/m.109495 type:complete len:394 (-) Transcript_35507:176-1357(-)|eukprot:CAMPEP_0174828974 /NCGR_PEP_ID=MMETSP1114-20130205/1641_1 /TAXON_ID=312471 /ORGANISM="Neobodo designis, Strain CCAP 1951/1" /LENGTH=393 /DNA_ID=CAMNT_0016062707 /DNA_START=78 /DNA_END=1259 /DNA_ORIENTATION=+